MSSWGIPTTVKIHDSHYTIRNGGDYRVILDCMMALQDEDLEVEQRVYCALKIFYPDYNDITDYDVATLEMYKFISNDDAEQTKTNDIKLMDWEQDFKVLVAPINRVLNNEIRSLEYLHWWTFLSAYMEIGDCLFSQIVNIRNKKKKGKKLEKHEQDFYNENYDKIKFKQKLTDEEKEWLNYR